MFTKFPFLLNQAGSVLLPLMLLAPLAVVFWRMVKYQPRPEAEVRAHLEEALKREVQKLETDFGDSAGMSAYALSGTSEDSIMLSATSNVWISYYARRWVGVCGLGALATAYGLLLFSTLIPPREPITVSRSSMLDSSPERVQSEPQGTAVFIWESNEKPKSHE